MGEIGLATGAADWADWLPMIGALGLWLVVMRTALRRAGARWAAGAPLALSAGLTAALLLGFSSLLVPAGMPFAQADLRSALLLVACVAAAFAWPLMAMRGLRAKP